MQAKERIAIIVQRYGLQVNGGAEMHARMIAEKLNEKFDVTVLTSCALDYHNWDPVLKEGGSYENGIKIIRFANGKRNIVAQELAYKKIKMSFPVYFRYKLLRWFGFWMPYKKSVNPLDRNNILWLENQGPAMPSLISYLKENRNNYGVFIFFTSLYYPTALGLLEVASKSILVPTMHNEAASFFPVYQKLMKSAKWIMYNTDSERRFAEKIFCLQDGKSAIAAVGINLPNLLIKDSNVIKKFNIKQPYIIYIGRIDESKGCHILLDFFLKYLGQTKSSIQLVMVGKSVLQFGGHPSIVFAGFVSDEDRLNLLMNAEALVIPSKFESLSLVLLESFACKVPVIANGETEVLKDHILNSKGGWCYYSYNSFKKILDELLQDHNGAKQKGINGLSYVSANYSWPSIMDKYYFAIDDIRRNTVSISGK